MSLVIALVIYAWERGSISAAAIPIKIKNKTDKLNREKKKQKNMYDQLKPHTHTWEEM